MTSRSFVVSALCSLALLALAAPAHAQVPPPPGAYTVTVALDDVLLPLLAAAELDAAQGRPALAMARAQVVLDALPATSTLRVRAEGVRLVAQQSLPDGAPPSELDALLEPLAAQAEQDVRSGANALAVARLDFVLARAPAGGPLAARAQAVRAAATQALSQQAPSQPITPQPITPIAPQPVTPQQPGVTPYGYVPAPPGSAAADPELPRGPDGEVEDPTRRGNAEAVELYITAAAYGVYLGFWIPFAAGLESGGSSSSSGENLGYTLSMLAGGGLMALLVAGLDSGDGLRTGVGPSISMGIRYGLGMGFLMWGALDPVLSDTSRPSRDPGCSFCTEENRAGWAERTALPMAFGLGGGLLGAIVGYGAAPSTDDVRFVETSGIWGTGLGLLLAVAAAQDSSQGFGITATGLGLGLLTTSIIAGAGANVSARRGWLMTLGFLVGAGAGTIVPALAAAGTGDFDVRVFGAVAAATSIAGLVAAYFLTEGIDERREPRRAGFDPLRDIQLGAGPTDGGGVFTMRGQF